MKRYSFLLISSFALLLTSCTELYEVYVRNATTKLAVFDVYLFEKSNLNQIPDSVGKADKALNFSLKIDKFINSSQALVWVGSNHFELEVQPNTTIDITEMERIYKGDSYRKPSPNVTVTLTVNGEIDTLINNGHLLHRKYNEFKSVIRNSNLPSYYYYDIQKKKVR